MSKNIKYNADTTDLSVFMEKNKSVYYAYIFLGLMVCSIFFFQMVPAISNLQDVNEEVYSISLDINIRGIESDAPLVRTFQKFNSWISRFGTTGEEISFSLISISVFKIFLFTYDNFKSSPIVISLCLVLCISVLQIFFVLIACWKVWFIFVVYCVIKTILSVKPYVARDILGVTGNGRVFFSGVKAGIKKCDKNGNPTLHVPGLTCLSYVPYTTYKKSAFFELLEKYGANNLTNQYLASIILYHYEYPAFIKDGVKIGNLFEDTFEFLNAAYEIKGEIKDLDRELNVNSFGNTKKDCMLMCLTQNMKKDLDNISYKNIATAILALEAGRILAYEHISNDRWAIQSNYPHLCARAVLHSSQYYGDEYDFDEREMLRKALIFTERKSDFLTIRMPLNMTVESYLLRQWLELILNFNNVNSILDELLFFAKSTEVHKTWTKIFVESIEHVAQLSDDFFVTDSGQLFVKINLINSILPSALRDDLIKMSPLIAKVFHKRETENMISQVEQKKLSDDNNDFLRSFSEETKLELRKYLLNDDDIIVWQNLRSCLNAFSWLGKRVSDRYVSYSGVVDCKFLMETDKIKDELGMVLFRTSKLIDFLGPKWSDPIERIKKVKITKNSAMKLESVEEE